ncbi:Chromobox protein 1 [Mortierella antarctica]|nr:Chromobox protein 1 [Mortierella antarctica]
MEVDKPSTFERQVTPSSPDSSSDSTQDDAISASTETVPLTMPRPNETEYHLQNILAEIIPEGTVVTEGAIERISKAFTALIENASEKAADKALARFNKSNRGASRSGSRRTTSSKKADTTGKAKSSPRLATNKTSNGSSKKRKVAPVEEDEYEVESILTHRLARNGGLLFHIKWKGYPESEATWEERNDLMHCQELLKEYAKKHRLAI